MTKTDGGRAAEAGRLGEAIAVIWGCAAGPAGDDGQGEGWRLDVRAGCRVRAMC